MLLIPRLEETGDLSMKGYSFKEQELEAVNKTFRRAHIHEFVSESLPRDRSGRLAKMWFLRQRDVHFLEAHLKIRFLGYGDRTITALPMKEPGYCCREIQLSGNGPGREEFQANDQDEALVKCALIAHNNRWLGGDPKKGPC